MYALKPSKVPFFLSVACIAIYIVCVVLNAIQGDWLMAAIWALGTGIWYFVARTQLRTYRIEQETYLRALEFELKHTSYHYPRTF